MPFAYRRSIHIGIYDLVGGKGRGAAAAAAATRRVLYTEELCWCWGGYQRARESVTEIDGWSERERDGHCAFGRWIVGGVPSTRSSTLVYSRVEVHDERVPSVSGGLSFSNPSSLLTPFNSLCNFTPPPTAIQQSYSLIDFFNGNGPK